MEEQFTGAEVPLETRSTGFKFFPFFNRNQPVFVLVLLGFIFYFITLLNEYALDDGIIIHQNEYVLKGVKGVKGLLTNDTYDSFYKRMNASDQLEGGRYRPLVTISYALEQEVIGTYRSGFYNRADDLNHNGKLDDEPVEYTGAKHKEINYECNSYVDLNKDKAPQPNECYPCWDLNKNFHNETKEDLNHDGVINEVDCQVKGAWFRHFNNVWLYILCCLLIYVLFRNYMLRDQPDIAFLAALIFLAHPVHSEVVANIKGRDELFSVIFICLTFIFSFKFIENKKIISLIACAFVFFLALMSKEYALLMPFLIPIALHVFTKERLSSVKIGVLIIGFVLFGLMIIYFKYFIPSFVLIIATPFLFTGIFILAFRREIREKNNILLMVSLLSTCLFYLAVRISAVGLTPGVPDRELLNNPYLLATGEQEFATKITVMLTYLRLTVFPHPLVSDYSYDSIAYRSFTSWDFILSLIVNLSLLGIGIKYLIKRHALGFAILAYYIFIIPVCNFFFASSTVMLETYLFHSSIGFSIAFAWIIVKGLERIENVTFNQKRTILLGALTIIIILFGCKTIERDKDWKNDVTLFLKDVNNSPNSVLVLGNAGARWIDLADTKEITGIPLPGEDATITNDYNGTLKITDEEMHKGGYANKREAALNKGIGYLQRAIELHPRYVNGYLNLGLAFFKLNKEYEAIYYWKMAENLYPNNPYLANYYMVYTNILSNKGANALSENRYHDALKEYNKCVIVDPYNPKSWYNLGGCYYHLQNFEKAKYCWEKALKLKPDYEEVKRLLNPKV
ncbi:MAG: tetratricopeptide repeat protein [Bacteroidia bacterium]